MLVIAHRGGPQDAPENTLAAFRHALALGADGVELDVQRTKDGALVIMHDETVARTTGGRGAVRDLTLAEVRALDAGQGERVPLFEEALALAQAAGAWLLAELKSPHLYPGLEAEALQAVVGAGYLERTLFMSFDWAALDRLRALEPRARLGALYGLWQFDLRRPEGVHYVCPMAEMMLLAPGRLRQAQRQGRPAFAWIFVADQSWVLRALRRAGAYGVITNRPRLALAEGRRR